MTGIQVAMVRLRRSAARAGFTLLEVLIALTILAVSVGVLFTSFSMTANGTRIAHSDVEIASAAQSVLARVGIDIPLRPGEQSGRVGELDWTVTIAPYAVRADPSALSVIPLEISLKIQKGGTDALSLKTLRLAPRS
jgi:general secretion pathway protein I